MIAHYNPSTGPVNPISRWEDDGGPAPATSRSPYRAPRAVNVGDAERTISALAGGCLVFYGLSRHSLSGLLTAIVGGGLVYRGMTGHCGLYDALGVSTEEDGHDRAACDNNTLPGQSCSATLASGPVEYRSSATPPMHATADDLSEISKSGPALSEVAISTDSIPTGAANAPAPGEAASPHMTDNSPSSHPSERHPEVNSGAEPQGRT
jgi:hypothetical protein